MEPEQYIKLDLLVASGRGKLIQQEHIERRELERIYTSENEFCAWMMREWRKEQNARDGIDGNRTTSPMKGSLTRKSLSPMFHSIRLRGGSSDKNNNTTATAIEDVKRKLITDDKAAAVSKTTVKRKRSPLIPRTTYQHAHRGIAVRGADRRKNETKDENNHDDDDEGNVESASMRNRITTKRNYDEEKEILSPDLAAKIKKMIEEEVY